ncbi:MAG: 1-(5-phosphoribosyl)-5-((5-phosphoribosylamino)methylideneamino)imidazole-4-carboxamide isomerase, partial [Clostridia bacterium]|nr:1-(5-phosphoribosyl)-5-((5-phosphoribosylamino)methylideneamino)imidazole-4-carboxamide isomerase [Clostridia bacterium]
NIALYRLLAESTELDIIASGGVTSIADVRALAEAGVSGAIIGKACYTGAINLAEAIGAAKC